MQQLLEVMGTGRGREGDWLRDRWKGEPDPMVRERMRGGRGTQDFMQQQQLGEVRVRKELMVEGQEGKAAT